ncbi:MAG: AAA domain-containing protein [Bacteroidia bacterium]
MQTTAREEIDKLSNLLQLEKEEEFRSYNEFIKNASLQERRHKGVCWYPLMIRETGYGLGDYPFLVVERTSQKEMPHIFSSGKMVSLFSNQAGNEDKAAKGTIHYLSGNTMKIILNSNDLPDWLDEGKLGVNLLYDENAYKEMERALKKVLAAENNRLAELREILLGYKPAQTILEPKYIYQNDDLNPAQNKAVNLVLAAKDVAVIHGPPGTGKTTTLVQAIKEIVKTEKRILVCAPSNAAADLLTEKIGDEGVKVVRVGNLSRIDEGILHYTLEGMLTEHADAPLIKKIKKQADEYRRMALKYKRHFGRAEREQRNLLLKEAKNLGNDAVNIENYIIEDVLNKAQVVTCTLVGAMNRYIENHTFSTVIIDEAAQALEPAAWVPITKAQKVVLAGDPFQLPPTVKSEMAQKEGLYTTLIEKCIQRLPDVSLLDTQYRMNEVIMGFSNEQFYKGALQADVTVRNHTLGIENNVPLEFIDTAGCSYDEKHNPESQSLYNPGEAEILFKHLQQLADGFPPGFESPDIGIISPYREQVVHLNEVFLQHPLYVNYHKHIDINTIDSFQGQERDVIYISLVRSNEKGEIGFLNDHRRMNVALTRARKKLVVIGDSATLAQHKFYDAFLQYAEKHGKYTSAWEFMQ